MEKLFILVPCSTYFVLSTLPFCVTKLTAYCSFCSPSSCGRFSRGALSVTSEVLSSPAVADCVSFAACEEFSPAVPFEVSCAASSVSSGFSYCSPDCSVCPSASICPVSFSEPAACLLSCGRFEASDSICVCSPGVLCTGLFFPIALTTASAVPDTINAIRIVSNAVLLALSAHIAL